LSRDSGRQILLERGLLWRDPSSAAAVAEALSAEGVPYDVVEPAHVGRFFPGLRPDGESAVWQPMAGPVLAAEALTAHASLLERAGGRLRIGSRVVGLDVRREGVRLDLVGGDGARAVLDAEVAVLAPGPGAPALVAMLGLDLRLQPVLQQVGYVDGPGARDLPCLLDGWADGDLRLYAMATPGTGPLSGYKLGVDELDPRPVDPAQPDRQPRPEVTARLGAWVAEHLPALDPTVRATQVCTWTTSPDGRFVWDRLAGGRIVLACGDSGEGFKFSPLMGQVLADLAEGIEPDADVAAFGLARLAG